jgi:hypothetical protein
MLVCVLWQHIEKVFHAEYVDMIIMYQQKPDFANIAAVPH